MVTVTQRQHLWHAALVWIVVGIFLCARGLLWLLADPRYHPWLGVLLPLAALIGLVKGGTLLARAARRISARIGLLPERTPIWRLYSRSTYLIILGMMTLGLACRWAGAHWHFIGTVGFLYIAVGVSLISGSRAYWSASD
ncbi:MAG: hypothetical protein BWY76_00787 [bacterium ADurb.Bin429]|nr:MAG: hypothetical protein BWY76_00787 [bacterium ADurb.Bin429]